MTRPRRPLWLALLGLAGCSGGGPDAECEDACPEGMNFVNIDFEGVIVDGTMVFETDTCTAYCEPVFQCNFPNLPSVTEDGYQCEAIAGYATIPSADDVDTGFGLVWRIPDPPTVTPLGQGWTRLAFGDVDADGLADIVTYDQQAMQVHFGVGDGTFEAPITSGSGISMRSFVLGEFTGDGLVDVAHVEGYPGDGIEILAGDGLGTFAPGLVGMASFGQELVVADVDNDGLDDLLTPQDGGKVAFADPGGTFTVQSLNGPWGPQQAEIRALDTDGDGRLEIAYAAQGGTVFPNVGGRSFGGMISGANGTADLVNVEIGDFDGNGNEDLLLWNPDSGTLDAYAFDGTGFSDLGSMDGAINFSWRRGDVDGDGALDAVNEYGEIWMSNFGTPYLLTREVPQTLEYALVDVDGDGLAEPIFADALTQEIVVVWP